MELSNFFLSFRYIMSVLAQLHILKGILRIVSHVLQRKLNVHFSKFDWVFLHITVVSLGQQGTNFHKIF